YSINSVSMATFQPKAGRRRGRDECERYCRLAAEVDCERLVVCPGQAPREAGQEHIREETMAVLAELSDIAQPYGVSLAFEMLGFAWCSVQRLDQAWDIVRGVSRDNVGLVLDSAHFYTGGSTFAMIDELDPRKVLLFHVNDLEDRPKDELGDEHRLLPGEGVIPLAGIISHLRKAGFDGIVSIEIFRPAYWERQPLELARAARLALARVMADDGRTPGAGRA
ncbi:MAG: sugar phosphate isomerase/epimerase family protein, partial [Chloroflexota bacterium]